jgi:hypothetical protein
MSTKLKWTGEGDYKHAACPECGEEVVLLGSTRRTLCKTPRGIVATLKDEEREGVHCTNCCGYENQDPPEGVVDAEAAIENMDPVTIPFMAIGAADALSKAGDTREHHHLSDHHGGQIGIIAAVCKLAEELEQITRDHDLEAKMWAYDVAEPFGEAVVKWALKNDEAIPEPFAPAVRQIVEELLAEDEPKVERIKIRVYPTRVHDHGDETGVEQCELSEAEHISVYKGHPGAFKWVADFHDEETARRFAHDLAAKTQDNAGNCAEVEDLIS